MSQTNAEQQVAVTPAIAGSTSDLNQHCAYCPITDYEMPFVYDTQTKRHQTVCAGCLETFKVTAPGRFVTHGPERRPAIRWIGYDVEAA